jgi:hypothetical protein
VRYLHCRWCKSDVVEVDLPAHEAACFARPPRGLCEHYACRCARAAELAAMYDRTGKGKLLLQAVQVHDQKVECRL